MFTDFGFKTIKEDEKEKRVHDLFEGVSNKYDLMNDLMSVGLHRYWKEHFVKSLPIALNQKILDLASGTGDIAFKIFQKYRAFAPHITLCDLTEGMINQAKDKAINKGYLHQLDFIISSAEHLAFDDNYFDGVTLSFGLRNTTHKDSVLKEVFRVLKPGGWFSCLEFSKPKCHLFSKVYDLYSFHVIPVMGRFVAKDENAYQYLVESIRQFPDQETLKIMMSDSGFRNVVYENMSNGIVTIHTGFKPAVAIS